MKHPSELTYQQLVELVEKIQYDAYADGWDGDDVDIWNEDREIDLDFIDNVTAVLKQYDLAPEGEMETPEEFKRAQERYKIQNSPNAVEKKE